MVLLASSCDVYGISSQALIIQPETTDIWKLGWVLYLSHLVHSKQTLNAAHGRHLLTNAEQPHSWDEL